MDTRQAIARLVKIYAKKLKNGLINNEHTSADQDHVANALTLAEFAFKTPSRFFSLTRDDGFPTHNFKLQTLNVKDFDAALAAVATSQGDRGHQALREYLEKVLTPDSIRFAVSDRPCREFEMPDAEQVFALFGRAAQTVTGDWLSVLLVRGITAAAAVVEDVNFFGHPMTGVEWQARVLAFALLAMPAIANSSTVLIALLPLFESSRYFGQFAGRLPAPLLRTIVQDLQSQIVMGLLAQDERTLKAAATCISALYSANTTVTTRGVLQYKDFYNATAIEYETEEIIEDFERTMANKTRSADNQLFTFARYPCLVDTKFKAMLMQFEAIIQTRQHLREAAIRQLFVREDADPFLTLVIRRDRLVDSTLAEVRKKRASLRKPLRIKFHGEEGIDAGGLRKEFFQLLTKQLLDPDFGMFYQTSKRNLWIQPHVKCPYGPDEFSLVGTILGLAVYNNVILDVSFPQALYRKLMGHKLDWKDLEEVDPELASGLEELLRFEEVDGNTVEDVFCQEFIYTYELYGEHRQHELIPGGKDKPLTGDNRRQFVDAMQQFILNDSISTQFQGFAEGFNAISDRDLMRSMHPEELELLVCGQPSFDFADLESSTKYEGFEPTDDTVVHFWAIVRELSTEDQRRFLKFTTGSDRVPVGGLKELNFVIGKNGDDGQMLPTAHTCFNHLLLPVYQDAETLRAKLLLAIQNCLGFGLQ